MTSPRFLSVGGHLFKRNRRPGLILLYCEPPNLQIVTRYNQSSSETFLMKLHIVFIVQQ
uniref:Uncharacterized protein n=1 Tax=Octopus bimaculoides TaxID=37653 RepID=A0A0L8GL88_OCTBM